MTHEEGATKTLPELLDALRALPRIPWETSKAGAGTWIREPQTWRCPLEVLYDLAPGGIAGGVVAPQGYKLRDLTRAEGTVVVAADMGIDPFRPTLVEALGIQKEGPSDAPIAPHAK